MSPFPRRSVYGPFVDLFVRHLGLSYQRVGFGSAEAILLHVPETMFDGVRSKLESFCRTWFGSQMDAGAAWVKDTPPSMLPA